MFGANAYTWAQKIKSYVAFAGALAGVVLTFLTAQSPVVLDWDIPGTGISLGYVLAVVVAVATKIGVFLAENAPTDRPVIPAEGDIGQH